MNRWSISFLAVSMAAILSVATSVTAAALAEGASGQVQFLAQQSGAALEGRFSQFSADVELDPLHPQSSKIKVAIDLASVDAGGADANNLLKGQDFFDVARFPSATFVATSVQATGPGAYQASGPFTIKGRTAQLVIGFVARSDNTGVWFEGSAPISRLAFKIGEGQWSDVSTLDDEVQMRFKVHVTR